MMFMCLNSSALKILMPYIGVCKSCQSCGQKRISNAKEQDIYWGLKSGAKVAHVAKNYNVGRSVVYRIKKGVL